MQIFEYQPPAVPWLDIRYQDQDIIIINKPSGLLSNPGRAAHTFDSAISRLTQIFTDAILVHRLDCDTSGIMVFARNKQAESKLKTQFQDKLAKKQYIAEIEGHLIKKQGQINLPLMADKNNPPYQKVSNQGKKAITDYQILSEKNGHSLIKLMPETGRTHQLRVHMLALGHAILGDVFYGSETVKDARSRLSLHAQKLTITHPSSDKKMTFYSKHPF
ncbi:MAG: RluA family pseudouridine synthase [Parashewanella sp.]